MYIRTGEGLTQAPSHYRIGDATASSVEADRRFKRVGALVTDGLKTAKDAVPQLSTNGQQDLVLFMTSVLDTFFPSGHGLIDAQGKVLRPSQKHTVAIPVEARDGARWQFEHRVRLFVSDQAGFRKSGEHFTGHFSSIRLFSQELHKASATRAFLVALHEMTHMMFAMFRRLENWLGTIGGDASVRILSREPWRLLGLSSFDPHRAQLQRHVKDLLRVIPIPMEASELATSLIEEAFAKVFSVIVDEAIAKSLLAKTGKRGPGVMATAGFSPKEFLKYYVLERGFAVTEKQLDSPQAKQIFERMTSDVDALAAALRMHLGN